MKALLAVDGDPFMPYPLFLLVNVPIFFVVVVVAFIHKRMRTTVKKITIES